MTTYLAQKPLVAPTGGSRTKPSERFGDLKGKYSYSASPGMDEHAVTTFQPSLHDQRLPSRKRRQRNRSRFFVTKISRLRRQCPFRQNRVLSIRAAISLGDSSVFESVNFVSGLEPPDPAA